MAAPPAQSRRPPDPRLPSLRISGMPDAGPRHRKPNLPQKTCLACGRPFAWRRKWRRDWDNVKTCSERCKAAWRRRARD